ncbi:hypothetical protein [Natrialba aegyptia]|uniref:hypothetical protein n=1 Tax=Natrialba aegyptia TaxID=129789 RepID=UPI00373AEB97
MLEFAEEVATRFSEYFTPTSVAVIICELVDLVEQFFWHRDTDDAHIIIESELNIKNYYPTSRF